MAENRQKLVHLHTPDVKIPTQGLLDLGEIAVQHNDVEAALYIQKTNGTIAKFIDATAVEAKVELEKTRAEGAEEDLANRIKTLEGSNHTHANKEVLDGITTEKVTAWNSAKADAISSAKTYVDSLNTAMNGRVDALKASSHTHTNKTVLDDITSAKVKAWDAAKANAISSAKTYADSLNTAMDSRVDVLETSSHTHANKTVLNGITAEKVTAWDTAEANAISSAITYTNTVLKTIRIDCGTY